MRNEQVVDVLRALDLAMAPFVPFRRIASAAAFEFRRHQLAVETPRGEFAAVSRAQLAIQFEIEIRRVDIFDHPDISLTPSFGQRAVEVDRPADAALLERELQRRKPARDAAKKERLANSLGGRREMTDLLIDEARNRSAHSPGDAERIERRGDFQPDR